MKIGIITAFYDEKRKGNEYYLAKYFSKKGHEVIIYVSKYSVPRYGKVRKLISGSELSNVTVKRLPSIGWKRKGMLWLRGLKNVVSEDKLDVIHIQEWFMPMAFQLRKLDLVLTQRREKIDIPILIYYKFIGRKLLNKAKAVSALTSQARNSLKKAGLKRDIDLIPNGVDTNVFKPLRKGGNEKFTILYVGRLSKEKGVDVLIKACQELNDYSLILLGSGPEENKLKKLAAGINSEFIGERSQYKLPHYYSNADVVVVPSYKEPFGFVTLEALSCGTPVIGSNMGGMRDVINERVGILVRAGNVQELHNALIEIKTRNLRKNCRDFVLKNYDWDIISDKYLDLYKAF